MTYRIGLVFLLAGCPSGDPLDIDGEACTHGGKSYQPGESFPSDDGCNTCSCSEGGVACTARACAPDDSGPCLRTGCSGQVCAEEDVATDCAWRDEYACYEKAACERQPDGACGFTPSQELAACLAPMGATCEYGGTRHKVGDSFPSDDGCNTCTCGEGGVACTKRACVPDNPCRRTGCSGQICADEDLVSTCEVRPEYACYAKASCERQVDGRCGFSVTKDVLQCLADHGVCHHDGIIYKVGATFPSDCNTCTCTDQGVACTERACPL